MPWYRTIISPEDEIETLMKRRHNTRTHQPPYRNSLEMNENWTPLSSFQYIIQGVKQGRIAADRLKEATTAVGIVIKANNRTCYWRNGHDIEPSEYIFNSKYPNFMFDLDLQENNFLIIKESTARRLVPQKVATDKTNPISSWTEGLFRYQANEIKGIAVETTATGLDYDSAYAFAKELEQRFHTERFETFYRLKEDGASFESYTRALVKQRCERSTSPQPDNTLMYK